MPDSNVEYLKLITSEYSDKSNFIAFNSAFLDKVSPANDCLISFDQIFAIDNAIGDQLDKIGEIIGVTRHLPTQDADIPSTLSDESYRFVLKAKIMKNHWDGTRKSIDTIFKTMFPGCPYDIVDNQDMTMNIMIIAPEMSDEKIALIFNGFIVPKPAGVKLVYQIMISAIFGWDKDTSFIKGWDTGTWANS